MSDRQPRNKAGVLLTVLAAGAAVLYGWLVVIPTQRAIGQTRESLEETREFILEGKRMEAELIGVEAELSEVEEFIDDWERRSPTPETISAVLARLTTLVREHQLNLLRFEPGEPQVMHSLQRQPLALEVSGSYADLAAFLSRIDREECEVWTNRLAIMAASQGNRQVRCELDLTVFVEISDFSE